MCRFFGMHLEFGIARYTDSTLYTKYSVYHGIPRYRRIDTVTVPKDFGMVWHRKIAVFRKTDIFGTISAVFRYFCPALYQTMELELEPPIPIPIP